MKFKIQLPLSSSDMSNAGALVYNEDRSILSEIPLTDDVRSLFKVGQVRVYVDGHVRKKDGKLIVDRIIGRQNW